MTQTWPGTWARAAVQASLFSTLTDDRLAWLFENGLRLDIAAGSVVYREGERPGVGLVVEGLVCGTSIVIAS